MAGSFFIDPERSCVFSRGWGVLTDADLLGHVRALAVHPRFRPGFRQCVDYLAVERVTVSSSAVRDAAMANPFSPGVRRVFVLNRVVMVGLVRMYELSGALDAGTVSIVESLADAARLLEFGAPFSWPAAPPDWSSSEGA